MVYFAEPIQTVLVSCRAAVELMGKEVTKDNLVTLDWHMPVSFEPQLYAVSVAKQRFSHELITKSRCFAVNFMPFSLQVKVLYCGTHTGSRVDKFHETKLTRMKAQRIGTHLIMECPLNLECEVVEVMKPGGTHDWFIGEVVAAHKNDVFRQDNMLLYWNSKYRTIGDVTYERK